MQPNIKNVANIKNEQYNQFNQNFKMIIFDERAKPKDLADEILKKFWMTMNEQSERRESRKWLRKQIEKWKEQEDI
jgi:hypothetical protein